MTKYFIHPQNSGWDAKNQFKIATEEQLSTNSSLRNNLGDAVGEVDIEERYLRSWIKDFVGLRIIKSGTLATGLPQVREGLTKLLDLKRIQELSPNVGEHQVLGIVNDLVNASEPKREVQPDLYLLKYQPSEELRWIFNYLQEKEQEELDRDVTLVGRGKIRYTDHGLSALGNGADSIIVDNLLVADLIAVNPNEGISTIERNIKQLAQEDGFRISYEMLCNNIWHFTRHFFPDYNEHGKGLSLTKVGSFTSTIKLEQLMDYEETKSNHILESCGSCGHYESSKRITRTPALILPKANDFEDYEIPF